MIKVEQLSKSIKQKKILQNISFSLKPETIMGILGPNGAGKTTLMDILSGVDDQWTQGTITINGLNIKKETQKAKSYIGYQAQESPLYEFMKVKDFLKFQANIHFLPKDKESELIEKSIIDCNLEDYRNSYIKTLSKGTKRRLSLAQAILHRPAILILDEPSDSLDPFQVQDLRNLLKKLKKEKHTILVSSHILSEIEKICDEITIIHDGIILFSGEKPENQSIEDFFFSFNHKNHNPSEA